MMLYSDIDDFYEVSEVSGEEWANGWYRLFFFRRLKLVCLAVFDVFEHSHRRKWSLVVERGMFRPFVPQMIHSFLKYRSRTTSTPHCFFVVCDCNTPRWEREKNQTQNFSKVLNRDSCLFTEFHLVPGKMLAFDSLVNDRFGVTCIRLAQQCGRQRSRLIFENIRKRGSPIDPGKREKELLFIGICVGAESTLRHELRSSLRMFSAIKRVVPGKIPKNRAHRLNRKVY